MQGFATDPRRWRIWALVAGSTLVLTASFVGLVALAEGVAVDLAARLPAYVLASAATFVGSVVVFEDSHRGGRRALSTAGTVAVATFVLVGLGTEGVRYAVLAPGAVLGSRLFAYLLSAGLMGTGFAYWSWRNWRQLRTRSFGDAL